MTACFPRLPAVVAAASFILAAVIGPASAQRAACPSSNPPNELVVAGGSGQTAQLGKQFPASLKAQLANTNGCPVTGTLAGITVEFDAPALGPSGIFNASGSRVTTVGTDDQGVATTPAFTANDLTGTYAIDAHSAYGNAQFDLRNTADGLAATISASSGNDQAAPVYSDYTQPLQARLTDANGLPVQGAEVSFVVLPGATGASASFPTGPQTTATTNSDGFATSPPLMANGSPGRFTAVASTIGLASVAVYALNNHAARQTLTVLDGQSRSATIETRFGSPLAARLVDSNRQPVEGVAITFTLGAQADKSLATAEAGAAFVDGTSQATALTDATGVATSPAFIANAVTGTYAATANSAGSRLVFTLRNLPARISLVVRSRSTRVHTRYRAPLIATIRDNRGRPIRAAPIHFIVVSNSGASATFLGGTKQVTVISSVTGRATAPPLVANTIAGPCSVTAGIEGSTNPARGYLQNLPSRPATVTAGAASSESTPRSTRFPIVLAVTVTDRYGNRVPKASVTFLAPSHGASGFFAAGGEHTSSTTRHTDGNGIAIAPPFTANDIVGGYLIRALVQGSSARATFALANTPTP